MLNEKMKAVQIAIEQIINSFPKDYLNIVFGDRIIKEDLILQIMLECCKYAYDSTAECILQPQSVTKCNAKV